MRFKISTLGALVAIAVSAASGVSAKEWKTVRIGTEGAYPPFNFLDAKNELQGLEIDLGKALCTEMKVTCTFVAQDWDGIIPALIAGKYDAIVASMSITPEREQKIAFSKRYYQTPPTVIGPKNSTQTDVTPAGLKGKTIGTQSSTIHSTFLEEVYKGSTVKLYGKQDEANLDLANGRLDFVMADKTTLLDFLKSKDGACCKIIKDIPIDPKYHGTGVGVGLRKEDTDLKAMFDKAIDAVIANGTYDKIRVKYFDFDIK